MDNRERRLTVILHADVAGSTALVHRNETIAHRRITEAFRRFSEILARYGGSALEIRGDALLAEFPRASDAVSAALAAQAANADHNEILEDDIRPEIRVGIALGEVVIADVTVTGPGVVLAQRLEQLAKPGGLVVQGAVYEALPQRLPFDFESLGERAIKGFGEPVRAFAVTLALGADMTPPEPAAAGDDRGLPGRRVRTVGMIVALLVIVVAAIIGLARWESPHPVTGTTAGEHGSVATSGDSRAEPALPDRPSIAVLAFNNMSNDKEQDYFAEGISEDIITDLSKVSGLFVIARNSSFVYKGRAVPIATIAKELGVRYVLEGSVRRAGDQVRINAQLVDGSSGGHLWAERYDGKLSHVFDLQDQVRQQIVTALSVQLTPEERRSQQSAETTVPEAYDTYLKGWAAYQRQTRQDFRRARDYLEAALALDPHYSRAAAALSAVYWESHRRDWQAALHVSSWTAKKRAYAYRDRAMESPTSLALVVAADMLMWRGQHDEAIAQTRRAIELAPSDAYARLELAEILVYAGRPREAMENIAEAARLDPHGEPRRLYLLGLAHFGLEEYEVVVASMRRALALNPDFSRPAAVLGAALGHLRRGKEAVNAISTYGANTYWAELSTASLVLQYPYKHRKDRDRIENGLKLAGWEGKYQ